MNYFVQPPFSETHHGRSCRASPWGFSPQASVRAHQSRHLSILSRRELGLICLPPADNHDNDCDNDCDNDWGIHVWSAHLKKLCHREAHSRESRDVIIEEGGSRSCFTYSPEHYCHHDDDDDDHDVIEDEEDYLHQSTSSPTERGRGKRFGKTPLLGLILMTEWWRLVLMIYWCFKHNMMIIIIAWKYGDVPPIAATPSDSACFVSSKVSLKLQPDTWRWKWWWWWVLDG